MILSQSLLSPSALGSLSRSNKWLRSIYGVVASAEDVANPELPEFENHESFIQRHLGPLEDEQAKMLQSLGYRDMDALIQDVIPPELGENKVSQLNLSKAISEVEIQTMFNKVAQLNKPLRCFYGQGYYGTILPTVLRRNVLENPLWYTSYTPYQAEISQGRLEALLNYQTLVSELTGLPIANASSLDEGTAAADAMTMLWRSNSDKRTFLVHKDVFAQSIACLLTRAKALGLELRIFEDVPSKENMEGAFGLLVQQPDNLGIVRDWSKQHFNSNIPMVVAIDPLAAVLLKDVASMGAEVAIGTLQRFGLSMGYGGPHAAFIACQERLARLLPGRIVGISKDTMGNRALRLARQTREQHIRRERATSNICTAQALLAILAQFYAIYHGPRGLRQIAERVHEQAIYLGHAAVKLGHRLRNHHFFDTVTVELRAGRSAPQLEELARRRNCLLRVLDDKTISISLDETVAKDDLTMLIEILEESYSLDNEAIKYPLSGPLVTDLGIAASLKRTKAFLTQRIFNCHHSETALLRYITELQSKDLSLAHSMIPLGSCTMKLNSTTALLSLSSSKWVDLHPFCSSQDATGYSRVFSELEAMLCEITGFGRFSFMPTSGAQGELMGLLLIREYHRWQNKAHRHICLIPTSSHGTNAASAALAGLQVVSLACDKVGNIETSDFYAKLKQHGQNLAAIMLTYPNTLGNFVDDIRDVCHQVHQAGGLVYLDGANLNAMLGILRPADLGADVGQVNLHKTFSIPHGGGGPGMGPVGVGPILQQFLPSEDSANLFPLAVSSSRWGSASLAAIPWAFIKMLGSRGLKQCSQQALLSANYLRRQLRGRYPLLPGNRHDLCSHEFVIDCRSFQETAEVHVNDIAKRLQDYSIHSPTMDWPIAGTLLVEPTESESLEELDRFVEAMLGIREEIAKIEKGIWPRHDNPLKGAPHSSQILCREPWNRAYSREEAAFPVPHLRQRKFWPTTGRVDDVYGEQNFSCTC